MNFWRRWASHGGNSFDRVHATIVTGGQLYEMKQTPQDSIPREMTVATKYECEKRQSEFVRMEDDH
jgi:hypothetical protein